ncbi:hypothetical protein Pmani_020534 [Petrolisthes manimaculis]|uniref:Uncharacterized protein n=1 Tax=Petrolisthes manimaculis TaxID=1843537 RepID=A0AAE1U2H5_9EUCA|nr:hypothetical protein Pmani_020534 [Petrolisthes manimaculis]
MNQRNDSEFSNVTKDVMIVTTDRDEGVSPNISAPTTTTTITITITTTTTTTTTTTITITLPPTPIPPAPLSTIHLLYIISYPIFPAVHSLQFNATFAHYHYSLIST